MRPAWRNPVFWLIWVYVVLVLVFLRPASAQVLLSLTVFEPGQCRPILGPACKQLTLAEAVISNYRAEPILVTKARVLENMAYWEVPVVSDPRAAEIANQRAKDETWGKLSRYINLIAVPAAAGLAIGGSTNAALAVFGGKEWLTQVGTAAAARAPEIAKNAASILSKTQVTILPGQSDTLTAFTFAVDKGATYQQDIDVPTERFEKPEATKLRIRYSLPPPPRRWPAARRSKWLRDTLEPGDAWAEVVLR